MTKLARKVGALASTSVKFLDEVPPTIGAEHFVHAHLLRIGRSRDSTLDWSITCSTQVMRQRFSCLP